jgi:hypothetical protein
MSLIISGTEGVTFNDSSLQGAAASPYVLKNLIINGDMRIDQRNAGASVSAQNVYTVDRWQALASVASKYTTQQNAGSVTPPDDFTNYLGATSTSAYSVGSGDYFYLLQKVEGLNASHLKWGTASAKTVTLSFKVRSSLTGTFVVAIRSGADDAAYPATYTINSANTWETKSITIAGPTSGTFATTNSACFSIWFSLGAGSGFNATANTWGAGGALSVSGSTSVVGTNGATFYITGVQLEQNTSATPFERRLYNQELANCQRYYFKTKTNSGFGPLYIAANSSTTAGRGFFFLPVEMRVAPTGVNITGSTPNVGTGTYTSTGLDRATHTCVMLSLVGTGFTSGGASAVYSNADGTSCIDFTGAEL